MGDSKRLFKDYVAPAGWTFNVKAEARKQYPRGEPNKIDSWYYQGYFLIPVRNIQPNNYREVRQWVVDDLKDNIRKGWNRTSMLITHFMGVHEKTNEGLFSLLDGGHRYQAIRELQQEGVIPRNFAPRCVVLHINTPPTLMHAEADKQNVQNSDFAAVSFTDRVCSIDRLQRMFHEEHKKYATVAQLTDLQTGGAVLVSSHYTKFVSVWKMWY